MNSKIEALEIRIYKLQQKDAMMNKNIINKLNRKIRALKNAENNSQR